MADHGREMLLTIKTTYSPATDLGYLLHKNPGRVHVREFPFGSATVFYPEAGGPPTQMALFTQGAAP